MDREKSYWTIDEPFDDDDSSIVLKLTLDRGPIGQLAEALPETRLDCGHLRSSAMLLANGVLLCVACTEDD